MTKGEGRPPNDAATPTSDASYVFDNAGAQAGTRFSALAGLFDPGTIRHLMARGVSDGWHCLEVGAGGGSIATWLCERVDPGGHVVATDIDPRFLEGLRRPNLEVRRQYGRFLAGRLRAWGLVDVDAEGRTFMWQGGSAGADLMRANFDQLRDVMIASGLVTDDELDEDLHRLDDPSFLAPSPVMWTTWGRRPLTP